MRMNAVSLILVMLSACVPNCADCRFCSSKLSAEQSLKLSNGIRDVCSEADCQAKSLICCDKTLSCGCACNGIRNETECLKCLKHVLKIEEDEYCGVSSLTETSGRLRDQFVVLDVLTCRSLACTLHVRSATWRV